MNKELSFELEKDVARRIEKLKCTLDVVPEDDDEQVATDVTAYSAWNCAWIPPKTKDEDED